MRRILASFGHQKFGGSSRFRRRIQAQIYASSLCARCVYLLIQTYRSLLIKCARGFYGHVCVHIIMYGQDGDDDDYAYWITCAKINLRIVAKVADIFYCLRITTASTKTSYITKVLSGFSQQMAILWGSTFFSVFVFNSIFRNYDNRKSKVDQMYNALMLAMCGHNIVSRNLLSNKGNKLASISIISMHESPFIILYSNILVHLTPYMV